MYKFKLQPVLDQREFVEENLKKELASCKALLKEENAKLNGYKASKARLMVELGHRKKKKATISEILLYVGFIEQVSRDIEKQKIRVSQVKSLFDEKLASLVEAMKDKKSIEKLKEKEMTSYKLKSLKKEQNFLDEVAIQRFHTRR
ncbi:MAG: flagellar export protein FliJ [Deltaproteobacteria bacterium]|nr:flagellar export protein FliJ [Deltaproteobacteria bacterium]